MSYLSNFERSFSDHTLKLLEKHENDSNFPATLLINCLLGLLIVPKETALEAIPTDPLTKLSEWGISPECIQAGSVKNRKGKPDETLRGLVTNLRHSVAHFSITPIPADQDVKSLQFTNDWGLNANIPLQQLSEFVKRLAAHLSKSKE